MSEKIRRRKKEALKRGIEEKSKEFLEQGWRSTRRRELG